MGCPARGVVSTHQGHSLPGSAREGHDCRFSFVVGKVRWFWASSVVGRDFEDDTWPARASSSDDVSRHYLLLWFMFCVIYLFLMSQSAFYCSNFAGIFVGFKLDRPFFLLECVLL
jgi:hypothetical protein